MEYILQQFKKRKKEEDLYDLCDRDCFPRHVKQERTGHKTMHVVLFMCVLLLCLWRKKYRNDTTEINENSCLQIGWRQGKETGMTQDL